jgi:hypothetical protein
MKKVLIVVLLSLSLIACTDQENKNSEAPQSNDRIEIVSSDIIEKLSLTTKIEVVSQYGSEERATITDKEEIMDIVNRISGAKKNTAKIVTSEANKWILYMYDADDYLIYSIAVWETGYIGFDNEKEYYIDLANRTTLLEKFESY